MLLAIVQPVNDLFDRFRLVAGGFDVTPYLGSAATFTLGNADGSHTLYGWLRRNRPPNARRQSG